MPYGKPEWCEQCGAPFEEDDHGYCPDCGAARATLEEANHGDNAQMTGGHAPSLEPTMPDAELAIMGGAAVPGAGRLIGAVVCGLLAGPLLTVPMRAGFSIHFCDDAVQAPWGLFFWGDHWVWRMVTSIAAAGGAAALAGLVAREHGRIVGALVVLPYAFLWALVAYLAWSDLAGYYDWQASLIFGDSIDAVYSKGSRVAAIILALILMPIGYFMGGAVTPLDSRVAQHFDRRPWSVFGVRWFHWFWLLPILYLLLLVTSNNVAYGSEWCIATWRAGAEFGGIIPTLFVVAIYGTLYLIAIGCERAFQILAGFTEATLAERFRGVLKYALAYPLLSVLCQFAIRLLHAGLAWLAT